mmetsp:Transcript_18359/g.49679  ORF Transcript_18359/g.49679 Transcript_18359/m.49679 type:complete len:211 (-) Transcript_18359:330-962(-)
MCKRSGCGCARCRATLRPPRRSWPCRRRTRRVRAPCCPRPRASSRRSRSDSLRAAPPRRRRRSSRTRSRSSRPPLALSSRSSPPSRWRSSASSTRAPPPAATSRAPPPTEAQTRTTHERLRPLRRLACKPPTGETARGAQRAWATSGKPPASAPHGRVSCAPTACVRDACEWPRTWECRPRRARGVRCPVADEQDHFEVLRESLGKQDDE